MTAATRPGRGRTPVAPRAALGLTVLESRLTPALTFKFDYSLDSAGFFADPDRRDILEQAGARLASRIASTPAAIAPAGTNTWTAVFDHPGTGAEVRLANPVVPAGTLVVYVGGASLGGSQTGEGGPGGWAASGTRAWQQTVASRGMPGFGTWGGSLSFDTGESWYFGADPDGVGAGQADFFTVATHELGHLLGIGTSPQWDALVKNGVFTGAAAVAAHGSAPGVSADGAHWAQDVESECTCPMCQGRSAAGPDPASLRPVLRNGERAGFTELDYAALRDLGWEVTAAGQTAPAGPTAPADPGTPSAPASVPAAAPWNVPAGKLVVVSGPTDGTVQGYTAGANGALTPAGPAIRPFAGFGGPVRAVAADVNGDGTADVVAATGPGGGSKIRVLDGKTFGDLVPEFSAFEGSFAGGVFLAAGDLDKDGRAEVVVTPDQGGGPRVKVLSVGGGQVQQRADFFGIDDPAFRGGARAAVGDVNGDGAADLVVSAGFGGGPRVCVLDGASVLTGGPARALCGDFFAFEPGLRNGAYAAVADLNGDGAGDLVFGAGPGGGPRVFAVSGRTLTAGGPAAALAAPLANGFAGDAGNRGGVRVTARDLDGDGKAEVVTGAGTGGVAEAFRFGPGGLIPTGTLTPFGGAASDGVYVG